MDESKWNQEDEKEDELKSETTLEHDTRVENELHSEVEEISENGVDRAEYESARIKTEGYESVDQSTQYTSAPESERPSNDIRIEHVHSEAVVPVVKSKKKFLGKALAFVLAAALVGGTTYTIGYYQGKIHIEDDLINDRVEALIQSNYDAEIYNSVKDYIETSGISAAQTDADVKEIYKNVSSSVVGITSKTYVYDWFNNKTESPVSGSGVIIDQTADEFYIVTNYHVVENSEDVVVEIAKDKVINAKIKGVDEVTDLAILEVKKSDIGDELLKQIKPIVIGKSEEVAIGEMAIAIGNPLGYNDSITKGIISAVERQVNEEDDVMYIQTDAAINPGNSGGALVNGKGELIGINTVKIAETTVEGMGFAIPSDTMTAIAKDLIKDGFVSRPFIGIGGADVDENTAKLYNIPMGVLVKYVYEDSPAEEGGLKVMDLIVGINDENVYNMDDLMEIVSKYKPGDEITLKVIRDEDEKLEIKVTLGNRGKMQ